MIKTALFLSAVVVALASSAQAQQRRVSAADYGGSSGLHAVSGSLGFYNSSGALLIDTSKPAGQQSASPSVSGFFGIGGDYEFMYANDLTIGGLFRYYSTSDSISNTTEEKVSAWTISGMVRAYMHTDHWAPYVGAGFGIVNASVRRTSGGTSLDYEPSATLGFSMALGMLYKINNQIAVGVENLRVFALGEKIQGQPINDFMFRGRFIF